MRSGLPSPTMAFSSTTTLLTFSMVGRSNMMSSSTCSMIERNPRAPVFRAKALLAIACSACCLTSRSTPSMPNSFWYCLMRAFFGSVRIWISACSSSSSSVATTGKRPTNSGISPYLIRSSGSTVRSTSLMSLALFRLRTSAPKPMPLFSERLLHALARNVPGDRRVIRLPRDLVDLVDVDDAALRLVDVVVAVLQQLLDDVLHVLADVARLGERGGVGDHERDVEQPRERLREQRLARAGRADQEDVGLGELDLVVLREVLEPLVVVVNGDRQDLLRQLLADHVLVEDVADLARRRQVGLGGLAALVRRALLADDVVAQLYALIADKYGGAGDKFPHLVLALAAEGAVEKFFAADLVGHVILRIQATAAAAASAREVSTRSTIPYFTDSSAERKLSRSVSREMRSTLWPVCFAMISFSCLRR